MQNDITPQRPAGDKNLVSSDDDPLQVKGPALPLNTRENSQKKPPSEKRLHKLIGFEHWKQLTKRQRVFTVIICGLLLIGGVFGAMELFIKDPGEPTHSNIAVQPQPTTKPSRLTGLPIPIDEEELPVTAVMIENSPDARPQSGLRDAGVVFEAIAEGGITRFLTLFQEAKPDYIGPVRSVRPYYLDWLVGFDAAVAHAGGSAQALAQIRSQHIKDLDHGLNAAAYRRVSSRFAPHNLYTSRAKLLQVHKARGYNTSKFEGFARKKKEEPAEKPTAKTISFNISSFNYNSRFSYDKKSNSYLRSMAGKPHKDEKSGKQIEPKVVIALVAKHSYAGIYSIYKNKGSGTVIVFQDGQVIKGTWHKKYRKTELTFQTKDGKPLELNAGQTWIVAVDNVGEVKYAP